MPAETAPPDGCDDHCRRRDDHCGSGRDDHRGCRNHDNGPPVRSAMAECITVETGPAASFGLSVGYGERQQRGRGGK
jgi:hypothetical protein